MTNDNLTFYCLMKTSWSTRLSPSEPEHASTSTPFVLFLNWSHSSSPSYVCICDDRFIKVCWSALERRLLLRLIIPTSTAEDHTLCWQPSVCRIQPQLEKQMFVFRIVLLPTLFFLFFPLLLSSEDAPCSSSIPISAFGVNDLLTKCTLTTWKLACIDSVLLFFIYI